MLPVSWKQELRLRIIHEIHHERHAQTSYKSIDNVAHRGSDTRHEAIPTPLVQRALNTKHTHRPHRGGGYNANHDSLEYKIDNIYMKRKWHHNSVAKVRIFPDLCNFIG